MNVADDPQAHPVAREAARAASPVIERLARLGYGAKGVLYLAVAGFVGLNAAGERQHDDETDTTGVLFYLDEGPLGSVVLVALALGLTGHALWRMIQAILDPEDKGKGVLGVLRRLSYLVRGLLHATLVVTAVRLLVDEEERKRGVHDWSADLMHAAPPFGAWLVGIAGVAVIAYALDSLHKVWTRRLKRELDLSGLDVRFRKLALGVCRFGTSMRAAIFVASGAFIVRAALTRDPSQAKGFGDALTTLHAWQFGPATLAVFAVGLVAYAMQELLKAFRRDITPI